MKLDVSAFEIYDKTWALLTAGTAEHFNTMTISWGGLGTLWGKPVVTVYVKPIRYTHEFMEKSEYFTVSFYGEERRKALALLGSRSGRDCDKVALSGLSPLPVGESVTFREAEITLLCKKIYRQEIDLSAVPEEAAERYYRGEPVHTVYIGEVIDLRKA